MIFPVTIITNLKFDLNHLSLYFSTLITLTLFKDYFRKLNRKTYDPI